MWIFFECNFLFSIGSSTTCNVPLSVPTIILELLAFIEDANEFSTENYGISSYSLSILKIDNFPPSPAVHK